MSSIKKEKFDILLRPRITEKSAVAGSQGNCVVFQVHSRANKREIQSAVESVFDVRVKSVRTVNVRGKIKQVGTRTGVRDDWKKAYVYLEEGSSIDVIEGL